ncbi:MAG: enoyl-CoA hydratase, partial [Actinomycetota bacterium]
DAHEAKELGLVNHVVPHAELIPFTRKIALDIIGADQAGVRAIRNTYSLTTTDTNAWAAEAAESIAWRKREFSADAVAERRDKIMQRGRNQ